MKLRDLTWAACALLMAAACSESGTEPPQRSVSPSAGGTQVFLQQQAGREPSVYAFRLDGDAYRCDTCLCEGWKPDGTLRAHLPQGKYKFLFAEGVGSNLTPVPDPLVGATWEQAVFERTADDEGGRLPSDELFLQGADDAAQVYELGSAPVTVRAELKRAVGRLTLAVKRGYRDGESYREVPYTSPQSVLDALERVDLRIAGSALRVGVAGGSGEADVVASLLLTAAAPDADGFVRLDGPFLIPPAGDEPVRLELELVPAAGSPLKHTTLRKEGKVERNKQLEVTLWITTVYPSIAVEITQRPIGDSQEGDSGVWE